METTNKFTNLLRSRLAMLITARRVSITVTINKLINFCQKIPLIGRKVPDSLYGGNDTKTVITILANIFRLSKRLMLKAIYIGFIIVLSFIALDVGGQENPPFDIDAIMTFFFFLSFLAAPIAFGKSLNLDVGTDLLLIDKLRADAHAYIPARIYERKVIDLGATLPFAIILSLHESYSLLQALAILPLMIAVKIAFESVFLVNFALFRRWSKNAYKILSYIYVFGGLALCFVPFIMVALGTYFPFKQIVFHPLFVIGVLLAAVGSALYIHRYKHYRELAWGTVVNYNLAMEKVKPNQKKQLFGNSDKWNEKMTDSDMHSDRFAGLSGYAYFNKIFFFRHRKFFRKKIMIRAIIVGTALITLTAYLIFAGDSEDPETSTSRILPICFFFAYMLSLGRAATGAMFANCDASMLTYPFYRTPSVVIQNFYLRLKKILQFNAPAFTLLGLFAITGDILFPFYVTRDISAVDWMMIPPYVVTMVMIWLFFSFHDLFIYYIIQPYTSELGTKSKLFSFIQFGVYFLSYMNVMLNEVNIYIYMAIIISFTFVYVAAGLLSINKFCWKTFKLK